MDDHAAPLWLHAGHWKAAADAVTSIESWRRIPAPLAWMAKARLHLVGLQATWPMLAELAWLSPRRLDELGRRSPDPLLPQLMRGFEASFEGVGDVSDLAWFAAWVLTERPNLAEPLAAAQASRHSEPEQAMRVLIELLGLERQGRHHDIVARRKALRDLHPSVYAAYMKSLNRLGRGERSASRRTKHLFAVWGSAPGIGLDVGRPASTLKEHSNTWM